MGTKGTLRLGTCSWSSKDWIGAVYTKGTKPTDFIAQYAERYDTVEIDATFYAIPSRSTVEGWASKTPESFLFSAKVPKTVTHDKFLEDAMGDLEAFVHAMDALGPRRGPLLLQFPYFAKRQGVSLDDFIGKIDSFLKNRPSDVPFAVEVRNKAWITKKLCNVLAEHGVTLALIDHPWMYRPAQMFKHDEIITGDFLYVRWLGDRKGIEEITTTWNEHVVDRANDMKQWVPGIKSVLDAGTNVLGYVNNHYSGYAPGDVDRFYEEMA